MRPLFTDGSNSFWHFFFGILATKYNIILLFFLAYQCMDIYEKNILIDLAEFSIGYLFAMYFQWWYVRV